MPLLDIAISQPCSCFRNNILAFRSETHFRSKIVTGNDRRLGLASVFSAKSLYTSKNFGKNYLSNSIEVWHGGLKIEAVATLEIARVNRKIEGVNGHKNVLGVDTDSVTSNAPLLEPQSSDEDSIEVDEREKLRRMRISKANKGNTPWNKGRKHSPETLQRIKERTRLAMQDPKVKRKLINLGHAQSEETRVKIGVGVRLGWERRRERLMVQETCHYEWQNLIAVAARKGLSGEEALQWDSYKVLNKEIEKEWLQSVEQRKHTPKPKGSKRAPKSAEQKRKISAAIAAKWADPDYRDRVCSGLMKFHGITERVERKPKKKPSGDGQARKSPRKKDEVDGPTKREIKSQNLKNRVRRSRTPSYKDPLASSKLEMLKNIRAQRAAAMNKRTEAIFRAKLLIAEAEKAAEALELAAQNNPLAQASLEESRALISEAIQFIESTENEDQAAFENDDLSEISTEPLPQSKKETDADSEDLEIVNHIKVNGFHRSSAGDNEAESSILDNFDLSELVNGNASFCGYGDLLEAEEELQERISNGVLETVEELQQTTSNGFQSPALNNTASDSSFAMRTIDQKPSSNGSVEHVQKPLVNGLKYETENAEAPAKQVNRVKKWVRGRLVEVEEET